MRDDQTSWAADSTRAEKTKTTVTAIQAEREADSLPDGNKPAALREADKELEELEAKRTAAESKRQKGIQAAQDIAEAEAAIETLQQGKANCQAFIAASKERRAVILDMTHGMMSGTFYNMANIIEQASALQALERAEEIAPKRIEEIDTMIAAKRKELRALKREHGIA